MLSPKQERFVHGLVMGLSQRKAFIDAGYSTKYKSVKNIDCEASRLFNKPKVYARYQELMNEHAKKALWTRDDAVKTLKWLINKSIDSVNKNDKGYIRQATSNAILGAVKELNELELLYPLKKKQVEKIDFEISPKSNGQEDKISEFINLLKGEVKDEG